MNAKSNDLIDYMQSITEEMAREYDRIQKRATEDAGTAGDEGEENWADLFREWLPPTYQIVTKGRILSHEGFASRQIDVLVLRPTYPKKLLNKKTYLAGGVLAAFECKLTLKAEHIRQAVKNAVEIRNIIPRRVGTPYKELYSPIIYGLLAHSHSWKGNKSTPLENIENKLYISDQELIKHPREMLDILCVADLSTWNSWKYNNIRPNPALLHPSLRETVWTSPHIMTSYICRTFDRKDQLPSFTPVGAMTSKLLKKLAWEDPNIRQIAEYFNLTNIDGLGNGHTRSWEISTFSDLVRNKQVPTDYPNNRDWNEWGTYFD